MKATLWLCTLITTMLCITQSINALQYPDTRMYQDNLLTLKRTKPSLSIVNPLDVLRQRIILEMARRQMRENTKQVAINKAILKNIGKRDGDLPNVPNNYANEPQDLTIDDLIKRLSNYNLLNNNENNNDDSSNNNNRNHKKLPIASSSTPTQSNKMKIFKNINNNKKNNSVNKIMKSNNNNNNLNNDLNKNVINDNGNNDDLIDLNNQIMYNRHSNNIDLMHANPDLNNDNDDKFNHNDIIDIINDEENAYLNNNNLNEDDDDDLHLKYNLYSLHKNRFSN